jgi:hypothetical protein
MASPPLSFALLLVTIICQYSSINAASTTWETHPSHPILPGTAPDCNKWHIAQKGEDCSSVQGTFGISAEDFFRWNPSVSKDCTKNFWAETSYCVGVGLGPAATTGQSTPTSVGRSTTTPSKTTETSPRSSAPNSKVTSKSAGPSFPSTSATYTFNHPITTWNGTQTLRETAWPPTKTQAGQPKSCSNWHEVMVGDTCDTIADRYSSWITKEEL